MKRLREFLKETAALATTAAGDVAGFRGSLFSKPISRKIENKNKIKIKKLEFNDDKRNLKESLLHDFLQEANNGSFKATDVISKLKAASKKFDFEKDTVAFGIEDDSGKIIKVYVRSNQAKDFEKTLSELLNDTDEIEIPELLFNLKNKFEIAHVEWGKIEEDEEQETKQLPPEEDITNDQQTSDLSQDEPETQQDDELLSFDDEVSSEETVKSALDKVIDMLKADAAAREAEAKAKEAEAKAKEAEYAAKAAEARIKGEEEILDAEAFFRKQEEEKKEARRLAKLAKYRHEKAAAEQQDMY